MYCYRLKDGKIILISQGSIYVKVSANHIKKARTEFQPINIDSEVLNENQDTVTHNLQIIENDCDDENLR